MKKHPIISIAGTVGVGKSTFAAELSKRLALDVSYENVEKNPYLDKYYNDFQRWSFHLQIFFLSERFKTQKLMQESGRGYIQDRTIYEDVDIFAKMNFDSGKMSLEDYETYCNLFEAMVMTPYFPKPDLVIYLDSDLDLILKRIKERGRDMEIQTDSSYWLSLKVYYDRWIQNFDITEVLIINTKDYDISNNYFDHIIKLVENKLKTS